MVFYSVVNVLGLFYVVLFFCCSVSDIKYDILYKYNGNIWDSHIIYRRTNTLAHAKIHPRQPKRQGTKHQYEYSKTHSTSWTSNIRNYNKFSSCIYHDICRWRHPHAVKPNDTKSKK